MTAGESTVTRELSDRLLEALDEEVSLLDLRHKQAELLAGAILDRDEPAVRRLLEQMEQTHQLQTAADGRLAEVRDSLAAVVARAGEPIRLSELTHALPPSLRATVENRRRQLLLLAQHLDAQHRRLAAIVEECARINRLMLEALFPASTPVSTYDGGGARSWRPDTGLVDTEL